MAKRSGGKAPELAATPELAGWRILEKAGEGASGIVFRVARSNDGELGALKVAHGAEDFVDRERRVLARVQRRWGPALLDSGRLDVDLALTERVLLACGSSWMVSTWVDGVPLRNRLSSGDAGGSSRARLTAIVAHGVGRGLDELHRGGVRHGDVKPANVVLAPAAPTVDRASKRGATLVDLDLAADVADHGTPGGTPRYLAPEVRAGEAATPAADLYSLGLMLAEVLDADLAAAATLDPADVLRAIELKPSGGELAAWIAALVASSPGARPSAGWIASRAARWLELAVDPEEVLGDRRARVRRTYVAVRAARIAHGERPSASIAEPARGWLLDARATLGPRGRSSEGEDIPPLGAFETARWIVSLVGPAAATWPLPSEEEGALASRLLVLSEQAPPEAWTAADLQSPTIVVSAPRILREGPGLWVELTRALARPRPDLAALDRAEEELSSGRAPAALAIDLAAAHVRRGDVGRAFAALARSDGDDEALLLRAEIARRQSDQAGAEHAARRVVSSTDTGLRDAARALLGRLAWDRGDLARAEAELDDARGAGAAEVRALVAYARGELERGLAALDGASGATDGALGHARIEGTRGMLEHARGRARESFEAFGRAFELATRAGAVLEEATSASCLAPTSA